MKAAGLPLACSSHANVTCALVDSWLGAVSPYCEDEEVVSSTAAPSVRAGKLFENQLSVAGGLVAICQSGNSRRGKKADVSRYKGVFCDKSL